jgi:two-component system, OmpR family, response regulator RstA
MIHLGNILLVEDDEDLAELTQEYLQKQGFNVEVEHDGGNAVARIINEQPDLVLLDIMLPNVDGLTICQQVRASFSNPIMMLTARDDAIDEILGLEIGADDYLSKDSEPRLVAAHIKALLRRTPAPAINEKKEEKQHRTFGDLSINNGARKVCLMVDTQSQEIELTNPEYDLLWLLSGKSGQILSREDIFTALRGIEYDGQNRLIDITISQLRHKMQHQAFRIKTVRNKGYLFIEE